MSLSQNVVVKYGTPRHRKILDAVLQRYRLSKLKMREYYDRFNESEKQYRAFMPTREADAIRKRNRERGESEFTEVFVPYSYAQMLSAHTYWSSVFLGRSPVLQFMGRHGEGEQQVQAIESLIDYQVRLGGITAAYYVQLHDTPKYGLGVTYTYWDREEMVVSSIQEQQETWMGLPIPGKTRKVKVSEKVTGYVGNRTFNVRPYDFLPDPRVPLMHFQEGEFCGRETESSWNALVMDESRGRYFNLEMARKLAKAEKKREDGSGLFDIPDVQEDTYVTDMNDVGFIPLIEMVVELIPKDWELGSGELPEKWVFTVAGESVLIEARPYGAFHGKFPFSVLLNEIDAYSLTTRSMFEILEPMNNTLSWLFNTHFFNVRSALNNQFIYDPSRVYTKDLTRKGAGKLIRVRESMYGQDVRTAIHQLPVGDVTREHLRDAQLVGEMMQRISGVTDNLMGMVNQGGRKTATEIRASGGASMNRLKTMAEFWSETGFAPHAQMLVQNTQQYYSLSRKYKIAGDNLTGQDMLEITPESIMGFFDFVPVDGTLPVDRYAQANLWREILSGMNSMPAVAQKYDQGGIFEWMATLAGLKNIKQFRVRAMPDDMLAQQLDAGNVVALGGVNDGGRAGGESLGELAEVEGRLGNVGEPGQIPGMGQTG